MTETAVTESPPPILPSELDHLSWSGIKTYQTCPNKFRLRYIERVPEEFRASSLAFGSAFHSAAEPVHESRLQGTALPTVDDLLAVYDDAWSRETLGQEVQFCKDEDAVSLRELAAKMLDSYLAYASLEATLPESGQVISIEHANRFRLLAEVPVIESHTDLLELQGSNLVVSDLKTSRSRWNDGKVAEAVPQLILYSIGLLPLMKELGANRLVTRFVVVTKAKKPVVQVLQPQANQADVVRLKETVAETWSAINTGLFVKRESWQCNSCPFRRQCLGR